MHALKTAALTKFTSLMDDTELDGIVHGQSKFSSPSVGLHLRTNEARGRRRQYACMLCDHGSVHSTTELMRRNRLYKMHFYHAETETETTLLETIL